MTTQAVLMLPGTPIVFKDTDATYTITLNNLAHAAGQFADQWDRGAGAKPSTYRVRCTFQLEATHTGVLGERIEVYMATSDGTNQDGTLGTSTAALTADKKQNLKLIGIVLLDQVAKDVSMTRTFTVEILDRYVTFGVWNNTTDHLRAEDDFSTITVTPYTDEIQAAA
jgi:hypothetical protein